MKQQIANSKALHDGIRIHVKLENTIKAFANINKSRLPYLIVCNDSRKADLLVDFLREVVKLTAVRLVSTANWRDGLHTFEKSGCDALIFHSNALLFGFSTNRQYVALTVGKVSAMMCKHLLTRCCGYTAEYMGVLTESEVGFELIPTTVRPPQRYQIQKTHSEYYSSLDYLVLDCDTIEDGKPKVLCSCKSEDSAELISDTLNAIETL